MRKLLGLAVPLSALALTAAGTGGTAATAAAASGAKGDLALAGAGRLRVGTDNPAYPPWFAHNDPTNGKGVESAVAYAIADQLGFDKSEVKWKVVPFTACTCQPCAWSAAWNAAASPMNVTRISDVPPSARLVVIAEVTPLARLTETSACWTAPASVPVVPARAGGGGARSAFVEVGRRR